MLKLCRRLILVCVIAPVAPSALAACRVPDVTASTLGFTAMQKGEPFSGRFREFAGTLCLDPGDAAAGRIELRVDTGSVDSGLPEADTALRSALFLDAAGHPHAVFSSESIRSLGGDRFEASGTFSLREGTRTLTVPFEFRILPDGGARLEGMTTIRRLDYGVGIGEWLDTEYLDDEIALEFDVRLRPAGRD